MLSQNISKVLQYLNKQPNISCRQLATLQIFPNAFQQSINKRGCSSSQLTPINSKGTTIQQQQASDSLDDITDDVVGSYNENLTIQNELKLNPNMQIVANVLRQKFEIGKNTAERIIRAYPELRHKAPKNMSDIVDYLLENGATEESLIENLWLLSYKHKLITVKLPIIQAMKPRDINDFIPLLKVTAPRLAQLRQLTKMEESFMPSGHRIYFLSDKLKVIDMWPK